MPDFDVGDKRRLQVTFADKNNTPGDPTTVTFRMEEPDGTKQTFVYLTDPEIIRSGLGVYYIDWSITQAGIHQYEWLGVGNIDGVEPGNFKVRMSNFP